MADAPTVPGDTRKPPKGVNGSANALPEIPRGPRLTAAQQSLRDSLMLARKAQGWTWAEIAAEAGIAQKTAKAAVKAKREASPPVLDQDPIKVASGIVEGFQASIADFERMALAYVEVHPSSAVAAKRSADDARRNLAVLLQGLGVLPHELGRLSFVVDIRATVTAIVGALGDFERVVNGTEAPKKEKTKLLRASGKLRNALEDIAGTGREITHKPKKRVASRRRPSPASKSKSK